MYRFASFAFVLHLLCHFCAICAMENILSGFHLCPLCAILPVEFSRHIPVKRLPADRPREVLFCSCILLLKFAVCNRRTARLLLSASVPCSDALRVSLRFSCGLLCFYFPADSSLSLRANLHRASRSRRCMPRADQTRYRISASTREFDITIGFSVYSVHVFPFSVMVIVIIVFSFLALKICRLQSPYSVFFVLYG